MCNKCENPRGNDVPVELCKPNK